VTSDQPTKNAAAATPSGLQTAPERGAEAMSVGRSVIRWESGLVVVLIVVLAFGAWKVPQFLSSTNIFYVGLNMGEIAIMALPMMLIIITGEIDLSVASMLGLSGVVMGQLVSMGAGIWLAIIAALAVGALGGALNGFLIARMGLPSIAVTIGTLTLYRGIAEIVLAPRTVTGFPSWLTDIGVEPLVGDFLSVSAAIFIVFAVITGIVLHATGLGRSIYAIGLQSEAAQFSGIRVQRIKFSLFVLSGVICAFAGILFTAKNASVSYDAGTGLELTVVAIVLFGGVSIFGGRGTLLGVVLSVVIVGFLQQAITQVPASPTIQNMKPQLQAIVIGILLLLSVILPNGGEAIRRFRDWTRRRSDHVPALATTGPSTTGAPTAGPPTAGAPTAVPPTTGAPTAGPPAPSPTTTGQK
jgi:rhamnose transport system permease protein